MADRTDDRIEAIGALVSDMETELVQLDAGVSALLNIGGAHMVEPDAIAWIGSRLDEHVVAIRQQWRELHAVACGRGADHA